jgi:hypothetical protein
MRGEKRDCYDSYDSYKNSHTLANERHTIRPNDCRHARLITETLNRRTFEELWPLPGHFDAEPRYTATDPR